MTNQKNVTEQRKVLSEQFLVELRLSTAEYETIQEIAEAKEIPFDDIVSDLVHRYLHLESEATAATTKDQEDRMKDLRAKIRAEYDRLWHAVYHEEA